MFQNKYLKVLLFILLLTSLMSACEGVQTVPKYTLKGTSTKTPFNIKSTFTPTKEPPPTLTPSETPTPTEVYTSTPTVTETNAFTDTVTAEPSSPTPFPPSATTVIKVQNTENPNNVTVKVSIATNCRTGPGVSYPKLSPLTAGKTAALIGRDKSYTYWIIKDPGQTGKDCWLWGYYASTTGNTKDLKVYSAPQQPSIKASSTPRPSNTPKTPLPTETPNLTPATITNTPGPATDTPIPSNTPMPSNTPPPNSSYCSYTSVLTGEEQEIKNLINDARADHGLPKLKIDVRLVEAARDHGRDMTCHGTYSHTSTDGRKAWERISVALGHGSGWCYNHCCCSEIFYGGRSLTPQYEDNIHKRTILSKYSTRLGVGVIYYQHNGTIRKFYTVDFAKP